MALFPKNNPDFDAAYAEESAMIDSAEAIADALERAGLTRAELAERLGISRAEVTHRLRGERNITVRKLAATLHALGADLRIEATFSTPSPTQAAQRWAQPPLRALPQTHGNRQFRGYALPHPAAA